MVKIILATTSPYRREAFKFLGLNFVVEESGVEEYFKGRPKRPEALVKQLAKLKAESVAKNHSKGIVIGFDSVCWFKNRIFEKPKSRKEAFQRLKSLSGKNHQFYTGIYLIDLATGQKLSRVVSTDVWFRELTVREINKYLNQDPSYKTCALGYDTLGHYSSSFARRIEGSYNNLLRGIPLETIIEMLKDLGYKI